jgi:hypothetical protein
MGESKISIGATGEDFRMTVEYRAGVWEVSMSTAAHGKDTASRGFGATFDEAWLSMNPTWADEISKSPGVGRTLRDELGPVSKSAQFEEWQKSLDQWNAPTAKDQN